MSGLRWPGLLLGALVTAAFLPACGDDAEPPATLVAIARLPADSTEPGTPLRVFDAVTGKTKLETEPGWWTAPAFSPDGARLLALSLPDPADRGDDSQFSVHFFDVGSGKDDTIKVSTFDLQNMAWSPDSSRFAYSGKSGLVLTDRRGKPVGEPVTGIVRPDGVSTGGLMWAKDSQLVAASINGEILFATHEGKPAGKLRAEDFPGAQAGDVVQLMAWQPDGRLAVLRASRTRGALSDFFSATVANGTVTLTAYAPAAAPTLEAESQTFHDDIAEAGRLVPGGAARHGGRTADGEGRIVEVDPTASSPAGFKAQLVVFTAKGTLVIDPGLPVPSRLRNTYSVVITR
ncbi:MAG: WD40 repeat domain-containing protein [Chloroflexi bacterium]|nr:WD40 repeat domain-containing protein [Chloroflexota bacterium]